jgi:hypothetical protein
VKFYVYRLFLGDETLYIGKGCARRLHNQKRSHQCDGEIVRRFKSEREAYAFEAKLIAKLKPPRNQCAGGGGCKAARQRREIKPSWMREMDRIGTRAYAAKALLRLAVRWTPEQRATFEKVAATGTC